MNKIVELPSSILGVIGEFAGNFRMHKDEVVPLLNAENRNFEKLSNHLKDRMEQTKITFFGKNYANTIIPGRRRTPPGGGKFYVEKIENYGKTWRLETRWNDGDKQRSFTYLFFGKSGRFTFQSFIMPRNLPTKNTIEYLREKHKIEESEVWFIK
tara:strand:- start:38 stop:502 length:465 start_codon:yes stop_codon:yes gene_type:complete